MDGEFVLRLLQKIWEYDPDLFWHSINVANFALRVNYEIGLDDVSGLRIVKGALLHDLGKTKISRTILSKPGPLTETEWQQVRRHPLWGVEMLGDGDPQLLDLIRLHHERWDGSGYYGYKREDIPLPARIITLADALDAMISPRPYRQGLKMGEALAAIRESSGTQFDPDLVQALKSASWQPGSYYSCRRLEQVIQEEEAWLAYLMQLEDDLFRLLEPIQQERLGKISVQRGGTYEQQVRGMQPPTSTTSLSRLS